MIEEKITLQDNAGLKQTFLQDPITTSSEVKEQ